MTPLEIILSLGVLGVVALAFAWSQGRRRPAELGEVSHHWLAEHRMSQTQDPQR